MSNPHDRKVEITRTDLGQTGDMEIMLSSTTLRLSISGTR